MNKIINEWNAYLVNKKYSAKTVKDYTGLVNKIFKGTTLDEYEETMDEFFTTSDLTPSTLDKYVTVAVTFQKYLLNENHIVNAVDLQYKYKSKSKKNKIVRSLSDEEVDKIFTSVSQEDGLAVAILLDTGIRIDEFKYFRFLPDWKDKDAIKVAGKSKNERLVVISSRMRKLANDFMEETHMNTIWPGSYNGKLKRVKAIGEFLGMEGLTPHIFRHTFATNWIYNGHNPYILMTALGHTSLTQLEHYVANNQKATIEEWTNHNDGKNNHDKAALIAENKHYKLENKRLLKLLEEVENDL